jgi:hypothetical protein
MKKSKGNYFNELKNKKKSYAYNIGYSVMGPRMGLRKLGCALEKYPILKENSPAVRIIISFHFISFHYYTRGQVGEWYLYNPPLLISLQT